MVSDTSMTDVEVSTDIAERNRLHQGGKELRRLVHAKGKAIEPVLGSAILISELYFVELGPQ